MINNSLQDKKMTANSSFPESLKKIDFLIV